jgi:GntR family transcriptional regulator
VLPFSVSIRTGRPLHDQIVFAVTKAIVVGQLRPGDRFPSVRTLSQELEINPNTAQRVVSTLVHRGLLETEPGIGTTVAAWQPVHPAGRQRMPDHLADQVEQLVVDAKQLGMDLSDVTDAIRREWRDESK